MPKFMTVLRFLPVARHSSRDDDDDSASPVTAHIVARDDDSAALGVTPVVPQNARTASPGGCTNECKQFNPTLL